MPKSWSSLLDTALKQGDGIPQTRYFQLATVSEDGHPHVRTCVFRGSCINTHDIFVHTDGRSRKCEHLLLNPRFEACWYFPNTWQQFRLSGIAQITDNESNVDSDIRVEHWQSLSRRAQQSYFQPTPGVPFEGTGTQTSDERGQAFSIPPETFVLIRLVINKVDFLDLSTAPHTRIAYSKNSQGEWRSEALNP